jgi:Biotin-lipoyl like
MAKKNCFDDVTEITGGLVPKQEVQVRPDREGLQISKVLVEAGAKVNAGQALAQLVNPESQQSAGDLVSVQAPVAGIIRNTSAVIGTIASARAEPGGELELSAQIPTICASDAIYIYNSNRPFRQRHPVQIWRGRARLMLPGKSPQLLLWSSH